MTIEEQAELNLYNSTKQGRGCCYFLSIATIIGSIFMMKSKNDLLEILGCCLIVIGVFVLLLFIIEDLKMKKKINDRKKAQQAIIDNTDFEFCSNFVNVVSANSQLDTIIKNYEELSPNKQKITINKAFSDLVDKFCEDNILSDEEEIIVRSAINSFKISPSYDEDLWFMKFTKYLILKDLMNGILPDRIDFIGSSVNIQKDESIIYAENGVVFSQPFTTTIRKGNSSSVSVRVAKGVYYKTGSFQSIPVTNTELKIVGEGNLYLTNKNIYFVSTQTSVKIPYNKVINYLPEPEAIEIQKDGSSKPYRFSLIDGWFVYNFVNNIGNIE